MATLSAREVELRRSLRDDFEFYAKACLKIRTKAGQVIPFGLNRSQAYLHDRLEAQRKEKGRVRALVLKGRQVGISTYIGGRFYWRSTHTRGYRTFILAHLDLAADNLFNIAKRYHDNCPDLMKPQTGASNAKELSFPLLDGGYKVATAGSKDVGRSETIQLFHGSELGFWPNADQHFAGIMQALADAPGTECILESTANGIGNTFHTLWKAAERGDSDFEAVFLPWFIHEEYAAEPPPDWHCPQAFTDYGESYDLTPEQVYWAWRKNRELAQAAGGTTDEVCWHFKQEYPANADEAFQSSGEQTFIPALSVMRARKNKAVQPYGPILIGVDPARGGGDKTGIIDRQGRVMGRHVCKRVDYGHDAMPIAGEVIKLFRDLSSIGTVLAVVDTTGLGGPLYDRLREVLGDRRVVGVNFASRAYDTEHYVNRRAEIWDLMRIWFDDAGGVACPDNDEFQGDVCAPVRGKGATRFNSNGQMILEDKDHIRERLSFSPDLGDAAALTFAVDMGALLKPDPDDDDGDDYSAKHTRSSVTGY